MAQDPKAFAIVGTDAIGNETLSVSTSAVALGNAKKASRAVVTVEDQSVRYWVDGSSPTTSAGHLVAANDAIYLDSDGQVSKFRVIAVTGTAKIQVTYF